MVKNKIDSKVKNKKALAAGFSSGILVVLFIGELFQAFIALLAGAENISFELAISGLTALFHLPESLNIFLFVLVIISPLLLIIILFEIGMKMLGRSGLGTARYSTIIFEMILIGYLIINVFYGAIAVVMQIPGNDWVKLVSYLKFPIEGGVIFMFSIILILAAYLNVATKRVINYINA